MKTQKTTPLNLDSSAKSLFIAPSGVEASAGIDVSAREQVFVNAGPFGYDVMAPA